METEYTARQLLTAGSDLVSMLIQKCNAANSISGFLKEYLTNLTDDEGIYKKQQAAMERFAAANARMEEEAGTMISSTRQNSKKIQDICSQFTGVTRTLGSVQQGHQAIDDSLKNLTDRMKEITDFIRSIQDVSEQTNLLSFNASIEAARAGNAGKGFRIIANEVKALSDRTTKLSEDIDSKVRELQAEMNAIAQENKRRNEFMVTLQRISDESSASLMQINEDSAASANFTENVLGQISAAQKDILEATTLTEQQNIAQAQQIADRAADTTIDTGDQLSFLYELRALFDYLSAHKELFATA